MATARTPSRSRSRPFRWPCSRRGPAAITRTAHRSAPDGALWLQDIATEAWWEYLEESRTAYVSYNFTSSAVSAVVNEVEAAIDAGDIDRLVVDARHNPGGNNTTFHSLRALVQESATSLPAGAYVIFGRATFSAAGNFVTDIDLLTEAVLVGEDSGTSPNQYGDSYATDLTHSRPGLSRWALLG